MWMSLRARYLLAMKPFAARVENDADDIAFLYRQLGLTTVEQGLDLVEEVYHGQRLQPKVQFLLTEIVDSLNDDQAGRRGEQAY
ncbi:MAG: hypothetical protein QOE61_4007 [Micromonosporaceae bacterium]|nr:hypothetical protein [Micromonosporaceae bacterium]